MDFKIIYFLPILMVVLVNGQNSNNTTPANNSGNDTTPANNSGNDTTPSTPQPTTSPQPLNPDDAADLACQQKYDNKEDIIGKYPNFINRCKATCYQRMQFLSSQNEFYRGTANMPLGTSCERKKKCLEGECVNADDFDSCMAATNGTLIRIIPDNNNFNKGCTQRCQGKGGISKKINIKDETRCGFLNAGTCGNGTCNARPFFSFR